MFVYLKQICDFFKYFFLTLFKFLLFSEENVTLFHLFSPSFHVESTLLESTLSDIDDKKKPLYYWYSIVWLATYYVLLL